ncbi:MAG: hypothetical protein KOO63_13020, partial [Bacteroidales bacterium]|nr:hypothetical protein [Candidatus Latescibacterota bacterium]
MRLPVMLIVLLALVSTAAGAIEISHVEVSGNVFVSHKKIVSIFGVRQGEDYTLDRISQGIKRLIKTKDFADVSAWYRDEDGKAVIILHVEEYPRVKGVHVEGNDHVDETDIRGKLLLREGFFARPAMISSDLAAMKEIYTEKGYNRAEITVRKTPVPDQHMIHVTYVIAEGRKVKIRYMDLIGNGEIDSKKIRKTIESHEDHWWSGGEYKPGVLEEDLTKIETLYRNQGYLDVKATVMRLDEIGDGSHVDIYIKIDEGERNYVGDLIWSGNIVVEDEDIRSLIALKKGDP